MSFAPGRLRGNNSRGRARGSNCPRPGVDLVYYGNQRQLEYNFVVAPEADRKAILLRLDGADRLELAASSAGEQIRLHKPLISREAV